MKKKHSRIPLSANAFSFDQINSPLGTLYLIFLEGSLIEVELSPPPYPKKTCADRIKEQFVSYFHGELKKFDLKINFIWGTPFQREVWLALNEIPYGEKRSYKWLAARVGRPEAARAIGQALRKNPLPVILPCHRVINESGEIGGYSEGVEIKKRLLKLEENAVLKKR
jgi:methylated-DNA-[protein]-cysteine S-methyltransferase